MESLEIVETPEVVNMQIVDMVRQAGVRRGIKSSISKLEDLRATHSKRSSGYNDLSKAIAILEALSVEEAENM